MFLVLQLDFDLYWSKEMRDSRERCHWRNVFRTQDCLTSWLLSILGLITQPKELDLRNLKKSLKNFFSGMIRFIVPSLPLLLYHNIPAFITFQPLCRSYFLNSPQPSIFLHTFQLLLMVRIFLHFSCLQVFFFFLALITTLFVPFNVFVFIKTSLNF